MMQNFLKFLETPIQYLKGVGPRLADLLARLNIKTFEDLLYHIPHRYIDFKAIESLSQAQIGEQVMFKAKLLDYTEAVSSRSRKKVFSALFQNKFEILETKFFRFYASLTKQFKKGRWAILQGELSRFGAQWQMVHPQIQWLEEEEDLEEAGIIPVYPLTEGLNNKMLLRFRENLLIQFSKQQQETLPAELLEKYQLPALSESFESIHQPVDPAALQDLNAYASRAHQRLIFEEFFYLSLGLALKKAGQGQAEQVPSGVALQIDQNLIQQFLSTLPFTPTQAQQKVIQEILKNLSARKAMSRLVQGDVGCGKTLVAIAVALGVIQTGYQVALMAPTEILAEQHTRNIQKILEPYPIKIALLKSAMSAADKREVLEKIKSGEIHFLVGTHSLIEDEVEFKNLALAIIDEQHRFGVMQRAELKKKGDGTHILIMTATPIPRTLAMTVYGDLEISTIDELPKGRQPIDTRVYSEKDLPRIYEFARKLIAQGRQIYFIYPLVDESEKQDLKNATQSAAHLQEVFREYKVGLVHGQMKSEEKEEVLHNFLENKIQILVSTTVIEVGIDVPNATLMVVEHAERFGLSQLHQMRGRVGRGSEKSYCFLVASWPRSETALQRLQMMSKTNDGFKIAEADLEIRGPGDFMGTRQSGLPDFRIANLVRDLPILEKAKKEADAWIESDPHLSQEKSKDIKEVLFHRWKGRLGLTQVG
ncbi:MAG: ATP-dependent DNA helicase RecG [Deltaproteobacteria bacterium]|nr:ATP-dependent DNA helicase RecG [Deltaproteobacteria bacterium]